MGAEFDADSVLIDLRRRQALTRRRKYRRSRLDRYRAELVKLRNAGASLALMKLWLQDRRLAVSRSTISRYLGRLPELRLSVGGANG